MKGQTHWAIGDLMITVTLSKAEYQEVKDMEDALASNPKGSAVLEGIETALFYDVLSIEVKDDGTAELKLNLKKVPGLLKRI